MLNKNIFICLLLGLCVLYLTVESAKVNYEGYSLIRVVPKTKTELDLILNWMNTTSIDVWNQIKGVNSPIDMMLSPAQLINYGQQLNSKKIFFKILHKNIQTLIDSTTNEKSSSSPKLRGSVSVVGKFARYQDILSYMDTLAASNQLYVSTYTAGMTAENREIRVLRIRTPSSTRKVWIDCGIHAREWISPATCVWIMDKLIKDYNAFDPEVQKLLNYYEFHIVPVLNPDGYEYTFTTDRMWRKNRNPNNGNRCVGVDANRNFNSNWLTGGSSTDPCSETYAGRNAGSEFEVKAVERIINLFKGQWDSFLTLHSYGQYWFTPYGYGKVLPSDYSDLYTKAKVGADALYKVNGAAFKLGSSANLLYIASGGSEDWAKDVAGIKYSYCLELRPDDSADNGFIVSESEIVKSGTETYAGIKAMMKAIKGN